MRDQVPEAEAVTTFNTDEDVLLVADEQRVLEAGLWADAGFFDVFSFPLLHGDPATALADPAAVVLTESLARTLFGDADVVGRAVEIQLEDSLASYTITGVAADVPANSHLQFSFVRNLAGNPYYRNDIASDSWENSSFYTYAALRPGAAAETLERSVAALIGTHLEPDPDREPKRFYLEPLTDIHLHSHIGFDVGTNGDARLVTLFAAVAVLVLLLACVNYTNLAVARSAGRAREVGIRKAVGASRRQIVAQHLTESVVTALAAFGLGLLVAWLALPLFESWMDRDLSETVFRPSSLGLLLLVTVGVGLVSGAYPAFVLTVLRPARVLKGEPTVPAGRVRLRSVLVVGQFASALILVIGSLVISRQLAYVHHRPLGFDRSHVVTFDAYGLHANATVPALTDEIARLPGVLGVTASSSLPTNVTSSSTIDTWTGHPEGSGPEVLIYQTRVDAAFFDVYGMEVVAGRGFSEEFPADTLGATVLNETAARALGWTPAEAVGRTIGSRSAPVVGVVRDFHMHSMHQPIAPLKMERATAWINKISVRVRPEGLPATLAAVETLWRERSDYPFNYAFLDEEFAQLYAADEKLGEGILTFTVVALFIAGLGLFGLAAFTAQQRTKEVGVRKVLGASVASLVGLLSKDFLRLVVVAFVVAIPIAYVATNRWLEAFTYHIPLGPGLFAVAGGLAIGIALLAVSGQALRAATADPVRALRSE